MHQQQQQVNIRWYRNQNVNTNIYCVPCICKYIDSHTTETENPARAKCYFVFLVRHSSLDDTQLIVREARGAKKNNSNNKGAIQTLDGP
jgi:hypothetical protein